MKTDFPEIDALQLSDVACRAAVLLKQQHPTVKFTSGRRGVVEQANAMASNIIKVGANGKQLRNWIEQTYVASPISQACQAWVNGHPEVVTKEAISFGLFSIMSAFSDQQRGKLSKHFSGDAFDVQPIVDVSGKDTPEGLVIKKTIMSLPGITKFLDHEGGLVRWHAQF